ncbi:uncharacterized protein N7483_003515 [Penicillium malachiteum]|uniref:uncharacterized protein n=1 Tax=Penicillium malachiteum TaxID=1324776 RepID=UPI002546DA7C|nr:uncharacterized protein N7483_003515 [Penicillium malachiteum]KAJ5729007.1 hypothetical protein N7483_003515 [Penicillium malachiteum]
MAAPLSTSEVLLIPKAFPSTESLEEVVQRYKKLRLHGLKVDPKSFSSTYSEESNFLPETWRSRVLNPMSKTFVAATDPDPGAQPNDTNFELIPETQFIGKDPHLVGLLRKEWVGIATLLGPIPLLASAVNEDNTTTKPWDAFIKDRKYNIPSGSPALEDVEGSHLVYLVVGMFISPEARRKGHASRLLEALIKEMREEASRHGTSKASITLQTEPGNDNAVRLYERLGFTVWDEALPMENMKGDISYMASLAKEFEFS